MTKEYQQDLQTYKSKVEYDVQQLESQINQKDLKIRALEKAEKKQMIDRDKCLSLEEHIRQLQERNKNIQTDRDLLDQEKRMIEDLMKIKDQTIKGLQDQL